MTENDISNTNDTKQPNYKKIYALLGSLFDPVRHNPVEIMNELSPCDRECLKILLHNMSMTLSSQLFQEQYSETVKHIKGDQPETPTGLMPVFNRVPTNHFINVGNGTSDFNTLQQQVRSPIFFIYLIFF
jgi:hypothetical protein